MLFFLVSIRMGSIPHSLWCRQLGQNWLVLPALNMKKVILRFSQLFGFGRKLLRLRRNPQISINVKSQLLWGDMLIHLVLMFLWWLSVMSTVPFWRSSFVVSATGIDRSRPSSPRLIFNSARAVHIGLPPARLRPSIRFLWRNLVNRTNVLVSRDWVVCGLALRRTIAANNFNLPE